MSGGGLNGGGWEFTKENILPLSSGRRMAHLEESLSATTATGLEDQQHYEAHHLQEIKKLEDLAAHGNVSDPLEAWVTVINYIEQHFPNMSPVIKKKHSKLVAAVIKLFYNHMDYRNDSRFVKLLSSSVKHQSVDLQIRYLESFLASGKGDLVSALYMHLASLMDGLGEKKKAITILKTGIAKVTDQKYKLELEEMESCYQHQWAEDYAKMMKDSESTFGESSSLSGSRSFANYVPAMGENNEAISIRQNLLPAAPIQGTKSSAAPAVRSNKPQSHSIYTGENPNDSASSTVENGITFRKPKPPPSFDRAEKDNENQLEACRWNSADTNLDNPVLPEPPAKLKLFQDEDLDNQPVASASTSKVNNPPVDKRVLQERKELDESSSPSSSQSSTNEPINSSTASTIKCEESAQGGAHSSNTPIKMEECNVFEMKYKTLPPNRSSNYLMLKVKKWKVQREEQEKRKELENDEKERMRRTIAQLEYSTEILNKQLQNLQEVQRNVELKLFEKDEKITNLEAQNEKLMHQLTQASTSNNVKESQFHREKMQLSCEMEELRRILEEERQQHSEEIKTFKEKLEALAASSQESSTRSGGRLGSQSFGVAVGVGGGKSCVVDIDVRSRTDGYSTSSPSISASADQGSSEMSKFHSGDTTKVEQQNQTNQSCVAASSFMPDLDMDSDKSLYADVPQSQPRKALGMVERPLDNDMMNMTPVSAPPMDFEIPRPQCFGGFGGFGAKKPKGFSLYQSFSDSMSGPGSGQQQNRMIRGIFGGSKRPDDVMKVIQSLPENMPPPPEPEPVFEPEPEPMAIENQRDEEHVFQRPSLFSDENVAFRPSENFARPSEGGPALSKPRRSMVLRDLRRDEPSDDEDEDDDEIILRRHQQTGMDLNVSNLTTYLNMCPKPLTNSTPEKERTLRNINAALGRETEEVEDAPVSDSRAPRARFSIMNEPPLNLSIIQETSHENRSRSTTGSSSGNTMFGATRLGMATSSTQLFGGSNNAIARSSSMPRSASRISQQSNMNGNGYYSDTNAMQ